jgi:hypothetical protein
MLSEYSGVINSDPAVNEMLKYSSDLSYIKPDSLLMVKPLKTEKKCLSNSSRSQFC